MPFYTHKVTQNITACQGWHSLADLLALVPKLELCICQLSAHKAGRRNLLALLQQLGGPSSLRSSG